MRCIPFVDVIEVTQNTSFGYVCGGMSPEYDDAQKANYTLLLDGAADAKADQVVTVYHSCQRALSGAASEYPFEVVNFTDVLAEALGLPAYVDVYGELAKVENLEVVAGSVQSFLEQNGVKLTLEHVELLAQQMFSEPGFFGDREKFVQKMNEHVVERN